MTVKVGDTFFTESTVVQSEGNDYLMMREEDILAIV
jgi:co-chaperonin GroES (HSP10)